MRDWKREEGAKYCRWRWSVEGRTGDGQGRMQIFLSSQEKSMKMSLTVERGGVVHMRKAKEISRLSVFVRRGRAIRD